MFLHTPLHKKLCGDERFVMESTAPKIRKHIIESDQTERIQTLKASSSLNSIYYCNGFNLSSSTVIVDKEKRKRRGKKSWKKKIFFMVILNLQCECECERVGPLGSFQNLFKIVQTNKKIFLFFFSFFLFCRFGLDFGCPE